MKKIIALLLCAMMVATLLVGCGKEEAGNNGGEVSNNGGSAAAEKTVINVMAFTDEVPKMVEKYIAMHPEENLEIKTTIVATTDGLYQPALDAALKAGGADAPDIYAAEAAFVLKYAQGEGAGFAAAYEDLGIDMSKVQSAEIAPYSVEIGTRSLSARNTKITLANQRLNLD